MEERIHDYRSAAADLAINIVRILSCTGLGLAGFGIVSAVAVIAAQWRRSELLPIDEPMRIVASAVFVIACSLPFLLLCGSIGALGRHEWARKVLLIYAVSSLVYLPLAFVIDLYWTVVAHYSQDTLILAINGFTEPIVYQAGFSFLVLWILKIPTVREIFTGAEKGISPISH